MMESVLCALCANAEVLQLLPPMSRGIVGRSYRVCFSVEWLWFILFFPPRKDLVFRRNQLKSEAVPERVLVG